MRFLFRMVTAKGCDGGGFGGFWGVGGACHRSYRRFTFDFSSLHDIRTLCNALLFFAMH